MTIHLPSLPVAVSTVPWHAMRQRELLLELRPAGFTTVFFQHGERASPYWQGVNRNLLDILTRFSPPFLLLEDDARFLPSYRSTIDIHPSAAVTYLGGTRNGNPPDAGGRSHWSDEGRLEWEPHDDDHVRVLNMQSCHAILFHDPQGVREFRSRLAATIDEQPADVTFAACQRDVLTLLRTPPFWYQDDRRHFETTSVIFPSGEMRSAGGGLS